MLLLAEAALRLADLPRNVNAFRFLGPLTMVKDTDIFWKMNPATTAYNINRLGLRGFIPGPAKGERSFRIACVGDSCTFGLRVDYEESYGLVLEQKLQEWAPGINVTTILAALPGYTTLQNQRLFEKEIVPLKPDLTILYCSGWNDSTPALGASDLELAKEAKNLPNRIMSASNLARLIGSVLLKNREPVDRDRIRQLRFEGDQSYVCRVSREEYRKNLEALIRMGRKKGGEVIAVLPPVPATTLKKVALAREYMAIMKDVMVKAGVRMLDGSALIDAHWQRLPQSWRKARNFEKLYFLDCIHPAAESHAILGRGLFELIKRSPPSRLEQLRMLPYPVPQLPRLEGIQSIGSSTIREKSVVLRGRGFSGPGAPERVSIGNRLISKLDILNDNQLRFTLPHDLTPGRHAITLRTPLGLTADNIPFEVSPEPLEVDFKLLGEKCVLSWSMTGPPGGEIRLYYSTGRLNEPLLTNAGPFYLAGTPWDDPSMSELLLFDFNALHLWKRHRKLDPNGYFSEALEFDIPGSKIPQEKCWFQGILWKPGVRRHGFVTELKEIVLQ